MDRVFVAGDTHGNGRWIATLCELAAQHDCDTLLQLGDFGIRRGSDGRLFLDWVALSARQHGVTIHAIGGNHEEYDEVAEWEFGIEDDGFVTLRPGVHWIPRGCRWEWGGWRFGALGGAFSVDHAYRSAGVDWWPDAEELHEADVDRLGDAPLDVLVTHEAPLGAEPQGTMVIGPADQLAAERTRLLLRRAVEATQPALVLHGHWHQRQTVNLKFGAPASSERRGARVEGLASDVEADGRSWGVLDLATLQLRDGEGRR